MSIWCSEVHNFEEPLETSHSCSFQVSNFCFIIALFTIIIFRLRIDITLFYMCQDGNSRKPSKISSICNWLQCQDIICGVGEGLDGTVCGKWRRYTSLSSFASLQHCTRHFLYVLKIRVNFSLPETCCQQIDFIYQNNLL